MSHLCAFKGKIPPLLAQIQQVPQSCIFLAVGLCLPVFLLQLGHPSAQLRILCLQIIHALKPVADAAEPLADGGACSPEGRGNHACRILQKSGTGANRR